MPAQILPESSLVTVIVHWETTAETQKRLIEIHQEQLAEVAKLPGFISASFHASTDGQRFVNYAQWESMEAFQAMLGSEEVGKYRDQMTALAEFDAHVYDVVATYEGAVA